MGRSQLVLVLCLAACTQIRTPEPASGSRQVTGCDYHATLLSLKGDLRVSVLCDAPVSRFIASEGEMASHVRMTLEDDTPVAGAGARFELPPGTRQIAYEIDLDAVAHDHGDIDVAYRAGGGWIAAVSTWILRPDPAPPDARIGIRVEVPEGAAFATGMHRVGDGFEIRARQIRHATYGVFGKFTAETIALRALHAGEEAILELVTMPGALSASPALRRRWVHETAAAIVEFWRGFPVPRALVLLIPTPERDGVVHGKVVASGGATVALFIGEHADRDDLYTDWILVHELFHLGVPSFSREGKWLDEGLATYFEPIIRARAGWLTPDEVWSDFERLMAQGLPAVEVTGVEKTSGFAGIYWGGAIICLLADVAIRERTGGRLGLEDGLRAVLAQGGNATEIWRLDRVIAAIDERVGAPALRPLADAHRLKGRSIDLAGVWSRLGVIRVDEALRLDDGAELARVRDAILSPIP